MFLSSTHVSSISSHSESLHFPTPIADMLLTTTILLLHLHKTRRLELSQSTCIYEPHELCWVMLPFKTINFTAWNVSLVKIQKPLKLVA